MAAVIENATPVESLKGEKIRMSMPAALCSYCLGETQLGKEKQKEM